MTLIRLIHWHPAEAAERAARLKSLGYEVDHSPFDGPAELKKLRQDPPAALVIDLGRLPSRGRDLALAVRESKALACLPLIFIEGDPEKVSRIRRLLPDAVFSTWDDARDALKAAIANPPSGCSVRPTRMDGYGGTPLYKKLGIKSDSKVALINAPEGFKQALAGMPAGAVLIKKAANDCSLIVWFVKSVKDLENRIEEMTDRARGGAVWIAWPKKGSAAASDLSEKAVRAAGLAAGMVDYKVCSMDQTWSGLLFTRKKDSRKSRRAE